jgi:hypothetical protein
MIILQSATEEHRTAWTSSPQGEPYGPPSVLTPQSPCTATRAVGVGTLYWDTIYAATAETNEGQSQRASASARAIPPRGSHSHASQGGHHSIGSGHLPKGNMLRRAHMRARPVRGLLQPPCKRWRRWAYVGRAHHGRAGHPYAHISPHGQKGDKQNTETFDTLRTVYFDNRCTGHQGASLPMGHPVKAGTIPSLYAQEWGERRRRESGEGVERRRRERGGREEGEHSKQQASKQEHSCRRGRTCSKQVRCAAGGDSAARRPAHAGSERREMRAGGRRGRSRAQGMGLGSCELWGRAKGL